MSSQPKGARGQRERDCLWYKLLGECDDEECTHSHENQVPSYSETVGIPEKIPLEVAQNMKGEYKINLSKIIAEHLIIPDGQEAVKIVTSDKEKLPKLVETYIVNLSLLLNKYPKGPGRCYIHHEGVSNCLQGTLLHFQRYKGRLPPKQSCREWKMYELCTDEETNPQRTTVDIEALVAENPELKAQDTMEDAYKEIEEVYGSSVAGPTRDKEVHRVRMSVKYRDDDQDQDHRDNMKEMLKGGLKWLCNKRQENGYVTKLEARFGKVLWGNLPEEMTSGSESLGIETFVNLLPQTKNTNHKRIFNNVVREESAGGVCKMLEDVYCSSLETYDIKFVVMPSDGARCGDRLDVRVKFEQGQPKVLLARKNEVKTLVFDMICLHRNQDIRMTLNHCEVVKPIHPLYNIVDHLIQTLALPNPDDNTISFVAKTKDWNVHFVRHKKRQTYVLEDKYMITVSHVQEYVLDWPTAGDDELFYVTPDLYKAPYTEIEFHSIAWECAFGRDAGFSPEQSLALHMEQPTIEPSVGGAIPHPWQPEHILENFDEVWEQLDTLNDTLGSP